MFLLELVDGLDRMLRIAKLYINIVGRDEIPLIGEMSEGQKGLGVSLALDAPIELKIF